MIVQHYSAMQAIIQISDVFRNNTISVINSDGLIIASTDAKRTGLFHEGAYKAMTERLDSHAIPAEQDPSGILMDISFPVTLDGMPAGAISVTGGLKDVMRHGSFLKRMMEFSLRETDALEQKRVQESIRIRFMEQWLTQENAASSRKFVKWGQSLGIDVTVGYRILVAETDLTEEFALSVGDNLLLTRMDEAAAMLVGKVGGHAARINNQTVCCLPLRSNSMLLDFAVKFQNYVREKFGKGLYVGIDEKEQSPLVALGKARKALECATRSDKGSVVFYDDIDVDIFIDEIPRDVKQEYADKVFKNCSKDEIEEITALVNAYIKHNRSINHVAAELFMHKNTVQYKIKKIAAATGYDMRDLRDSTVLYLATLFGKSLDL